jgi:hypothetical protein
MCSNVQPLGPGADPFGRFLITSCAVLYLPVWAPHHYWERPVSVPPDVLCQLLHDLLWAAQVQLLLVHVMLLICSPAACFDALCVQSADPQHAAAQC